MASVSDNETLAERYPKLTPRELCILQLVADGESCRSAASREGLSETYVKRLRCVVQIKLGADSMAHAVAIGIRKGLIS